MKRTFCLLLTLFCLLSTLTLPVRADFGGYSGGGDVGGSSYTNYGNDRDQEGGGSQHIFLGVLAWIFLLGGCGYGLYQNRNDKKPTPLKKLRPMSEYPALDPAFDEEALTEALADRYVQMQNRWTMGDIEPLRPLFTPFFFNQMEAKFNNLRVHKLTNYVENIQVQQVSLRGFVRKRKADHLYAILKTRILDYTLDSDGVLVSGNRATEISMTYEWDLCRSSGSRTGDGSVWRIRKIKHLPEE